MSLSVRRALYYTKQKIFREIGRVYKTDKWNTFCLTKYEHIDELEFMDIETDDCIAWKNEWTFLQSLLGCEKASLLGRWETACLEYLDLHLPTHGKFDRVPHVKTDEQLLDYIQTKIRDPIIRHYLLEFMRFGTCFTAKYPEEALTNIIPIDKSLN